MRCSPKRRNVGQCPRFAQAERRERPAASLAGGLVDLPASIARGLTQKVTGRLRPLMVTDAQMSAFKLLQQAAE